MDPNDSSELAVLNSEAFSLRMSDPARALGLATIALERAEALQDIQELGYALRTRGACRCLMGYLAEAVPDLEAAERLFLDLGDALGVAHVRVWMGSVARRRVGAAQAITHYLEALETFRAHGDRAGEAMTLMMMGNVHHDVHDFDKALDACLAARAILRELGDDSTLAHLTGNIGVMYVSLGDAEQGLEILQETLEQARELGDTVLESHMLTNIAVVSRDMGLPGFGIESLTECLANLRHLGLNRAEGSAWLALGEAYRDSGDLTRALECYAATAAHGRETGDRDCEIEGCTSMGEVLLLLGDVDGAEERLTRALCDAQDFGSAALEGRAHKALAGVYEARGKMASALHHFKKHYEVSSGQQRQKAEALLRARRELEEAERMRQDAKLQAIRSELQVLKAQMQPHFLLNALNAVATLVHRDTHAADEMLVRLGDLLRLALRHSAAEEVTLEEELEFLSLYVQVEQMRLDRSLNVRFDVDPHVLRARIPNFILQPLVENSIRHGLMQLHECPALAISAHGSPDGVLTLSVRDNGVGLPDGWNPRMTGIGLRNTKERLSRLYGSRYSQELIRLPSGGTLAVLRLPFHNGSPP